MYVQYVNRSLHNKKELDGSSRGIGVVRAEDEDKEDRGGWVRGQPRDVKLENLRDNRSHGRASFSR